MFKQGAGPTLMGNAEMLRRFLQKGKGRNSTRRSLTRVDDAFILMETQADLLGANMP